MDKPTSTSQTQLLDQIVKEFGLDGLSPDNQEKIVAKMTEVILKRMFLETMEKLSDEEREEYEKLIDGGATPEQIEEFLKGKIENYDEMLQKIVADFKGEMNKSVTSNQ